MGPGTIIATLAGLWEKAGILLWALTFAAFAACAGLTVAARLDPATYTSAAIQWNTALLPAGFGLFVLAAFRSYHDWKQPRLHFIPNEQQAFVGVTIQRDGRVISQFSADFETVNPTDTGLYLTEIRLMKPRLWNAEVLARQLWPFGGGSVSIKPHTAMKVRAHFLVVGRFVSGERTTLKFKARDQFGRWHRATARNVRVLPETTVAHPPAQPSPPSAA